jgi:uncharacterized oxidoreductase
MTTARIVLITGGTSGIGLGLARRYAAAGARVAVTGRSAERLDRVRVALPDVVPFAGDLAVPAERERLADRVRDELGGLDVLVNNAGVQRRVEYARDASPWAERQAEIDLLLAAPIHLADLLLPLLLAGDSGQIVNVTSGGAFIPQPFAPTYSAAKAGLHSATVTLRDALRDTGVRVTELIPPAVATDLAGVGNAHGADVDAFCDAVFPELEARHDEVGFGPTASEAFREVLRADHERFAAALGRFPIERYPAAMRG